MKTEKEIRRLLELLKVCASDKTQAELTLFTAFSFCNVLSWVLDYESTLDGSIEYIADEANRIISERN